MCPLWHLHTHRFEQIFGQRLATHPGSKCWNLAFAVVGPLREPRKICYSFRRFKGVGLIAFHSSFVSALSQPNHSPLSWFVFPASLAQKMGGFSAGSKGNWINIWQVSKWATGCQQIYSGAQILRNWGTKVGAKNLCMNAIFNTFFTLTASSSGCRQRRL